ncbi:hypothetical protein CEXT_565581 [Caerostris extrusa]|uniref:Uncharacterized protein n=1 Tax=Caerostris extrusa TaxID=172846 RepID=A0AAV4M8M1_CAEEX|nr:hypothetical protein CEXT_565581 [Caerostris extrusa]
MVTSKAITRVPFFPKRGGATEERSSQTCADLSLANQLSHRSQLTGDPCVPQRCRPRSALPLSLVFTKAAAFNPTPVGGCDFIVALDENGLFVRVACASVLCIFVDQTQPTGIWVFSVMFKDFRVRLSDGKKKKRSEGFGVVIPVLSGESLISYQCIVNDITKTQDTNYARSVI